MTKGSSCSYDAVYNRGRAPSVVLDDGAALLTGPPGNVEGLPALSAQPDQSLQASPEPSQTDRQGHYIGPASGVSFLLRVQHRAHQTFERPQTSSIFTFGDAPLPNLDPSFFVLPQKEITHQLLQRYFDFAVPTHRFLHRPTIEAWFEEFYATSGSMSREDEAPAQVAVLFMVFAQASLYIPTAEAEPEAEDEARSDASARYFLAAEHQLKRERGQVRLTSVQARLAQCFYLLSKSRINHCWSLFGTTAHLVLALGLNRARRVESSGAARRIEAECRRRVFWCAYVLDKYLAAALGRPRTLREEDIDQDLPSCIDDSDLSLEESSTRLSHSQPLMRAAIAHIKLSRIVNQILRDLYAIWPLSTSARLGITTQCSKALKDWYGGEADFLDPRRVNTGLLLPIYQRQRNVLCLAYWHATILAHRPFLLGKHSKGRAGDNPRKETSTPEQQIDDSIQECLEAAVNICNLVDELIRTKMMFKAFWVSMPTV